MFESQKRPGETAAKRAASLRGSPATLNEQLVRDTTGKVRDESLDELAVAAETIEAALKGNNLNESHLPVLRDLLAAIRVGESVVSETWNSLHG